MELREVALGKLEVDLEELAHFLVDAKKNCYAGNGEEETAKDGSKILAYQEGNFHYTDNYDGWYHLSGTELVRWKKQEGQRIWQMSYYGKVSPEFWRDTELINQTFGFLKKALLQVTPKAPFRGKENKIFSEKNNKIFNYQCSTNGGLINFKGKESIWTNKKGKIFTLEYIGGLVIPK